MKTIKKMFIRMIAIQLLITLLLAEFAVIGKTAVSYAQDSLGTNNEDIELFAYFENEQGEKQTEIEKEIDKSLVLKIDVTVKNERGYGGYFEGKIELEDTNFKLKKDEEISIYVNAGETKTIEKEIEYLENVEKESIITIKGKYVNSQKEYEIDGATKTKVKWLSPENTKAKLETKVLTNFTYQKEEESKRIVQFLVESGINNDYPLDSTKIELNIPDNVKDVKVHRRLASDETLDLEAPFYNIDKENQKLIIENGNVCVVTYEYEEGFEPEEIKINGESTIIAYDGKELKADSKLEINETIDGRINGKIIEKEEIYKGKIYTGEERKYTSTTELNVDYIDNIEEIKIEEYKPVFLSDESEKEANIKYESTTIKKSEFNKIFGEEGFLNIIDNEGNLIQNINKDTENDENGNIIIKYEDEITSIKIETSKPQEVGTLKIKNEKIIGESGYSREEIEQINVINEKVKINEIEIDNKITLKETESKATLSLENSTLSSLSDEEQTLRILAKLDSSDESKDLYKNPKIIIALPEEIVGLSVEKSTALYRNGLEIKNGKAYKNDDGKYEISLEFSGEQEKYDTNEGLEIYLELNVKLNKLAPSKINEIKMSYTNENKNITKEVKAEIKVESQYGLMLYNKLSGYNESGETIEVIDEEKAVAKLDRDVEARKFEVKTVLLNNYSEPVENIVLEGKVPTGEEKDTFKTTIKNVEADNENAKVTFPSEGTYKIEINSIEQGQSLEIMTALETPENLGYNQAGDLTENVSYIYNKKEENKIANLVLKTEEAMLTPEFNVLGITENLPGGLATKIIATSGNQELKDKDSIFEGQTIKYNVTITNNTGKDYNNVNIKVAQTNGKVWGLIVRDGYNQYYSQETHEHYYKALDTNETELGKIETFKNGESKTFEYETTVDNNAGQTTYGTISIISENGNLNSSFKTIENIIKDAQLKLVLEEDVSKENELYAEGIAYTKLNITNLSNSKLNDVKVKIAFSSNLSVIGNTECFEIGELEYKINFVNTETNNSGETIVTLNISEIAENEVMTLYMYPHIKKMDLNKASENVEVFAISTIDSNTYVSNNMIRNVLQNYNDITVDLKALINNKLVTKNSTIKNGDIIEFVGTVKNNNSEDLGISITESLIDGLEFQKAILINGKDEKDISNSLIGKLLIVDSSIKGNSSITIKISAKINTDYLAGSILSNEIKVIDLRNINSYINKVEFEVNKVVKHTSYEEDNNNQNNNNNNQNNNQNNNNQNNNNQNQNNQNNNQQNNNNQKNNYVVSGTVWLDNNENGQRDFDEEKMSNITIRAINIATGKIIENSSLTTESGTYSLNLEEGNYIILFLYDSETYFVTTYQANNVLDSYNSDAISRKIKLGESSGVVAATDEIRLTSDINNIDLGLVRKKQFDLKLDKYIKQIIVTNSNDTKTYDQKERTTLAKVEVKSKYLSDTNIVVKYNFAVTNNGEIAGYATNIVDYLPSSLTFSSSLNPDWYQSGENIYSTSLANTKIEPGETKEITLVLTKKMTASNTGLINNQAEIISSSNALGLSDDNNNKGSADLMISIGTGSTVSYFIATLTTIILMSGITYLIFKKRFKLGLKI